MKIVLPVTNSSSSNTMVFGWLIYPDWVLIDLLDFLAQNAEKDEYEYGIFYIRAEDRRLRAAYSGDAMAVGYPAENGIEVSEQMVTQLLEDVRQSLLSKVFGETYTLNNIVLLENWEPHILLESDEWKVSAPGLIFFSAGNEGKGPLNYITGVISIRMGEEYLPNVDELKKQKAQS